MSRSYTSVIFADEAHAQRLAALLPGPSVAVHSGDELQTELSRRGAVVVAFIAAELLPHVDGDSLFAPIVAIVETPPTEMLSRTVALLDNYPFLSHVISTSMLTADYAQGHLGNQIQRLAYGAEISLPSGAGSGRVAMLTHASRRAARFERMDQFFASHNLSPRTIAALTEVAEELVMNALYDAPHDGGLFDKPVPRTQEVELPPERACEISYGVGNGQASVRVRDTFGAFNRARLLHVLRRCNGADVVLDESRGGAGLGLWRIFTSATAICVKVVRGSLTDITVTVALKDGRPVSKHLQAVDLYFSVSADDSLVPGSEDATLLDNSVTITRFQ